MIQVMRNHIIQHAPLEQLSYSDLAKLLGVSKTTAVRQWLNYCQFATDSKQDPDYRTIEDLRPFFALMAISKAEEAARLMDEYDYLNSLAIAPTTADRYTIDEYGIVTWEGTAEIQQWARDLGKDGVLRPEVKQ